MPFFFLSKVKNKSAPLLCILAAALLLSCTNRDETTGFLTNVFTFAGKNREFGEPFGIAVNGGEIYVSDGETGRVLKIDKNGSVTQLVAGLHTPSGLAFDADGSLLIADAGTHSIKRLDQSGNITTLAGQDGVSGSSDGAAAETLFNGPIGIAVDANGRIFVSDTYNDRIRVIENGITRTVAGGRRGFADGSANEALFDTPIGLALLDGSRLLVADSGNHRIRVIENDGRVWTLAGNGENRIRDGSPGFASFSSPSAVAITKSNAIFIADGNAIRVVGRRPFSFVETISDHKPGLVDGVARSARFNRPSGLAITEKGDLIAADSDNQVVRVISRSQEYTPITPAEKANLKGDALEFRQRQPGRWPFEPAGRVREIAGTLGEIRGEIIDETSEVWFHNGLDIPGGYGETARFIRTEKVLNPNAVENFGSLRELLRLPTLGYIHIRLGRTADEKPINDPRFLFEFGGGVPVNLRIPRGTRFYAGDAIGTLNAMNHVHLITGRTGAEINALAALDLPGLADTVAPTIQNIRFYTEQWQEIETRPPFGRIKINAKTRIVLQAYDRTNGSAERRRLAPHQIGYEVFRLPDSQPQPRRWNISFNQMPADEAVRFVFAQGSKSGAAGETIFNFIATNFVDGADYREGFLDPAEFLPGVYTLRVFAADYFGNITAKDVFIEVAE